MVLLGEKQFEDPAHYAVPSAGVIWGSLSKELSDQHPAEKPGTVRSGGKNRGRDAMTLHHESTMRCLR